MKTESSGSSILKETRSSQRSSQQPTLLESTNEVKEDAEEKIEEEGEEEQVEEGEDEAEVEAEEEAEEDDEEEEELSDAELLQKGKALLKEKDYDGALEFLEKVADPTIACLMCICKGNRFLYLQLKCLLLYYP